MRSPSWSRGVVIQSTGKWYKVELVEKVIDCRLPGRFRLREEAVTNPVAVGDYVQIEIHADGTGQINEIEERANYLPRQATHGRRGEQILVANVDRAWAVVSIRKPRFKRGFIDRFLVSCEAYEVPAGILVNKLDLAGKQDLVELKELKELYNELGYPLLTSSIHDPDSLLRVARELAGATSVFIGPSGVGKSSLLNALDPSLDLSVGDISGSSNKGRHTTTYARLVRIDFEHTGGHKSGRIVDTPGIRELGLVDISPEELSLYFPEMEPFRDTCKYYNCTHSHEPGCAVVSAFDQGEIDPERYHSYLQILESLEKGSG